MSEEKKIIEAECPNCKGARQCSVRFEEKFSFYDDESGMSAWTICFVLQCRGCLTPFFLDENWNSEDDPSEGHSMIYYPKIIKHKREKKIENTWLYFDRKISSLLNEIYIAVNNDMPQLAAEGIRSLVSRVACDLTGENGNFRKNLRDLVGFGYVSKVQCEMLQTAIEVGHGVVHRGHIPRMNEVQAALDIVEGLMDLLYVVRDNAKSIGSNVPPYCR